MIQPIYLYEHPILRQKAELVTRPEEIQDLVTDLYDTLLHVGGAGLAAPQIGVSKRVILVGHPTERRYLINPVVLRTEGPDVRMLEGCLSVPVEEQPEILRPTYAEVSYVNSRWEAEQHVYQGILARIIMHEIDHLDGKLNFDLAPREWKLRNKKHLRAIHKGLLGSYYPCVTANGILHDPDGEVG